MKAKDIEGRFNDSLKQDAEQFGGENNSQVVPTHHIKVTSADLAEFVDTKETFVVGDVALAWRGSTPTSEVKTSVDLVVFVSEDTAKRLAKGEIVTFGIQQVGGENKNIHISKGGISDLFEDDRSPQERLRQEQPHLLQ